MRFAVLGSMSLSAAAVLGIGDACLGEGTGENALLIIDPSSAVSMYVGNYYKAARRIPDENVLYMDPANTNYAAFAEANLDGLFGTIANRGLEERVDFIVLTPGAPFFISAPGYVNDGCSPVTRFALSSAYTMAFLKDDLLSGPVGVTWTNGYYSNQVIFPAFDSSVAWRNGVVSDHSLARRYFIGAMLGYDGERGNTAQEIIDMIDRSVAADGTRPAGTFYFMDNQADPPRNVRANQYNSAISNIEWAGGVAERLEGVLPIGRHDSLGIMTGAANPNIDGGNFSILPGAFCDHLTSWAAMFDNASQTKLSRWIVKGASGSVGAVEEPCNYTGKFPRANMHYYYFAGATLGEAYFRSAQYVPFQMLLYGDPLTRPFTHIPTFTIFNEPTNPVSGEIEFLALAATTNPLWSINQIDVFVDRELIQSHLDSAIVITIDTTQLTDGYHELRLLAYDGSLLRSAGRWTIDLIVSNHGEAALLDVSQDSGDLGTLFTFSYDVAASGVSEVRLMQGSRVLAASTQLFGQFDVYGQTMGAGPVDVQLHAARSNGEIVRSIPIRLDIEPGAVTPSGNPPATFGYSRTVLADQPFVLELPATFDDDPADATFTIVSSPAQATIHPGATGGYRILVPHSNASGSDQLTFNVTTPAGTSPNATITWTYASDGIPGDITGDGCVDHSDLAALLSAWGTEPGDPNWNPAADITGDGTVGHSDLALLLSNWGEGC